MAPLTTAQRIGASERRDAGEEPKPAVRRRRSTDSGSGGSQGREPEDDRDERESGDGEDSEDRERRRGGEDETEDEPSRGGRSEGGSSRSGGGPSGSGSEDDDEPSGEEDPAVLRAPDPEREHAEEIDSSGPGSGADQLLRDGDAAGED